MRDKANYFLALFLFIGNIQLLAQQTLQFTEDFVEYKKGLALFEKDEYPAAKVHFDRAIDLLPKPAGRNSKLIESELNYYTAVCAAKLNYPIAEEKLNYYIQNGLSADHIKSAHFFLGSIYFKQGQYSKVVENFKKADVTLLSRKDRETYQFQYGYSLFVTNNYAEAQKYLKPLLSNQKGNYYHDAVYYIALIDFKNKEYEDAEKGFLKVENVDKYRYQIPFLLSQVYYQQKQYNKVITYAEPKLAFSDQNVDQMSHIVGQSYFELGNYKKAIGYLESFLEKNKRVTPEEMYQVAFAQYKTGKYKEAIVNLKELQLADGELAQNALYALADCYLKLDKKKEARASFASVAKYDFDKSIKEESEFNYGKLCFELGDENEAITSLKAFISKYPKSTKTAEAKNLLAEQLVSTKNYPEAIELMEDFDEFTDKNQIVFQKINYFYAVELYNDNKQDQALVHLDKSTNNAVDNNIDGQVTFLKAEILFEKKQYKTAMENYASAYQMMQKAGMNSANYSNLKALYGKAYCHYMLKEYNNAAIAFGKVIEECNVTKDAAGKAKVYPDALLRRGDAFFILKNYEGARNDYYQVFQLNLQGGDYALLQKATLDGLLKDDEARINSLQTLIATYKKSLYLDDAIYQLGSVYEERNDYEKAKLQFNILLDKYKNSNYTAKALLKLGLISYNENKMDNALVYYKTVGEEFSNTPESEQALKVIKEIYMSKGEAEKYINYLENLPNGKKISASAADSILFEAGEEAYANGDCAKTILSLNAYLDRFPAGFFANKAHFYRGECHYKSKKFDEAVKDYEFLFADENSTYYEKVLLKSVFILYNQKKNYEKSLELYKKVKAIASTKQNAQIASLGSMRASFYTNKFEENILFCDEILGNKEFAEDIQLEANYYKAKSLFATDKKDLAKPYLEIIAKKSSSENGAECKYLLAVYENGKGNFEKSLDICFELKDDFASYQKWVVKAFILIGDNYLKMDDIFQAKATIESLLSNFDEDKALVEEAKAKLAEIELAGKGKSKVDFK